MTVVNNGPRKGGEPGSFARAQGHALDPDHLPGAPQRACWAPELNTEALLTANLDEACEGNQSSSRSSPTGKSYTVSVPSTKHERTFTTGKTLAAADRRTSRAMTGGPRWVIMNGPWTSR